MSDAPRAGDDEPESKTIAPRKVYIHGLDSMNPDEVKAYVAEHFPDGKILKIEWIDDSSANLIFSADSIAQEALVALSSVEIGDIAQLPLLELLPAKSFSKRGEVTLQVRLAVLGDRKQVGAAQRSRFYLLNPEYDPDNRPRHRDRDGPGHARPRRRRPAYEDEEEEESFDVNLYDDDAGALASRITRPPRRRRSYTPEEDGYDREQRSSYRDANRDKELFPADEKYGGRSGSRRNRSASPARSGRGDAGTDAERGSAAADRNRRGARSIKERLSRDNRSKELFPTKPPSQSNRLEDADETSGYLSSRFSLPLNDTDQVEPGPRAAKLADRITAPHGRLADRITEPAANSGYSIRGAASQRGSDQGFAIKGGANKSAKELFPDKFGSNAGKELFSEKMDSRPQRRRQKAGDLFD